MARHLRIAPLPAAGAALAVGTEPIRVVLADDHARARRSLRLLLDTDDGINVVLDAGDVSEVIEHARRHEPHVLVLNLQFAGGATLSTIYQLREQVPGTAIIVLSMERSPVFAERVLDAGASGFVLKDQADAELIAAVRMAASGQRYVSPSVAAALDALRRGVGENGLSPRELEVLRLIALGYTSAEMAEQLHVSRRTIDSHRANIHRKLGLATRAELVHYALSRHLVVL